jgi:hypothetical protein
MSRAAFSVVFFLPSGRVCVSKLTLGQNVTRLEAALSAVNARLAEQDSKIQKMDALLELSKGAPQTVLKSH